MNGIVLLSNKFCIFCIQTTVAIQKVKSKRSEIFRFLQRDTQDSFDEKKYLSYRHKEIGTINSISSSIETLGTTR